MNFCNNTDRTPRTILQNEVECHACGERIFSRHRHDFVRCKCGNIAVDGGMNYLKRVGGEKGFTDFSIVLPEFKVDRMVDSVQNSIDTGRNALGIVCAIVRTMRADGLLREED